MAAVVPQYCEEWGRTRLSFHKDPEQGTRKMPFPSSEAFHNSFPISLFSESKKKNLHVLHDNWRRDFYLEVDGTQLFTAAFPLKDICSEDFLLLSFKCNIYTIKYFKLS